MKVRRTVAAAIAAAVDVSIHAPVKVRLHAGLANTSMMCFNPRTREGATYAVGFLRVECEFQSTHP